MAQAQDRVSLTLTALAGELPGFQLARQKQHGWIPTFFNASSGDSRMSQYTVLDTGLNSAGCLFARSYFANTAERDDDQASVEATTTIARLAKKVFQLVGFKHILCDPESSRQDDDGTAPPFTFDDAGGCGALQLLQPDGAFDCAFNVPWPVCGLPPVALTKEPCLICARRLRAALHRLVGVQPSLCRATPQRLRKQADRTDVGGLAEAPPLSDPLVHCGERQDLPTPQHVAVVCVPALLGSRTRISPDKMWSPLFACVRRYRPASVLLRGELQLRPEVDCSVREPLGRGLGLLQHLGLL